MFGCFSYGSRVTLADGTQEKIGKIVNQRMPVEVLSYDAETGQVVPRRVVNWFDNGVTDEFLQFTVAKAGRNGRSQFGVTANHLIQTPGGWREAGELLPGDRVLQAAPHHLSDFQWEVILGGLMGDGALSATRSGHGARFRWGHGAKQVAYGDWKASLFANVTVSRSVGSRGAVFHDVQPLPELGELHRAVYVGGKKVFGHDYLKQLTPLSLAIWYMDDGAFTLRAKGVQERTREGSGRSELCVEAMEPTTRERVARWLADTWNIRPRLLTRAGKAVLQFPEDETAKLHALVAPFVHPSMDYKLLPKYRGRFSVEPVFEPMRYELVPMPILSIAPKPRTRSMHRFDIEVEGNHNYFVDGVMVHNSPETTPGGRALKFYSSVRLDIRRIESIKDGAEVVGNRVRVKVAKNKCVAAGSTIFDPTTGLTHRIEDVVEAGAGTAVVAKDKGGRLHTRRILDRMVQGEQDVLGLRLRDGTELWVTPDHRVLTEHGWREAGELRAGDRVARPRQFGRFGTVEPVPPDHARLLGYLVGDGYVGGKTPIAFVNVAECLQQDAIAIAEGLGCQARRRGIETAFLHRPGERSGVLALARWAGIWGKLAPEKQVPPPFFDADVSAEVVGNLLFGLWESDGYVTREQTGAVRCGYVSTSEQLARQIHWLLLRFGVWSSVRSYDATRKRPSVIDGRTVQARRSCWEVRVSGVDNVERFAAAVPMWGPRGSVLRDELARPDRATHRGSQARYLAATATEPVLAYLRGAGVTAVLAAQLLGRSPEEARGGMRQLLGPSRLRRDRVALLADALDSPFLAEMLDEELHYARIAEVLPRQRRQTYDLEIEEFHNFVADGVVVHNCAPPFRQCEFDIMYGRGISREGSLIDVGVDLGIVKKSGAWFTYEGEQLGQGRENVKNFLAENVDLMVEISEKIKQASGITEPAEIDLASDAEEDAEIEG
jgi:recombination protein RecA